MSSEAVQPRRPMKFPYTFSAKIAQFPYAHYFNNQWLYRYFCYGTLLAIPVFWKLQKMSKSPENVAKYQEMRRREAAEHHH
ncbi:uncharacterized protein LOC105691943 [Athalia rosae]|uniref:uncharacterized protein LOC105691943 n=1 Tax=Athalia rosae TaxID=37344 RepID=UPI0020335A2F|nr:uncharacterized protein LOC105691943 [Athalia rosae]XP_012266203.2 uncharacterized protein LOC105691943 [Athalia rosae]XP_012266204.2 uncharacterized protein LOC105691943 [Athalia rosae]